MQHPLPSTLLILLSLACAGVSIAAPLTVPHRDISLEGASRLMDAAMATCHADGRVLAVAVVDRGGNLVALRRDDGVGPHNTAAAQRKAYTALSTKTATRLLAANSRASAETANLNTVDTLLLLGGGVPLMVEGELIGAIGIAGAGGPATDEACAIAAMDKVFQKTP
ncbi:GlcG/HbpS family heme-binding protein [Massilia sp. DWR3-1-1]|uniref:GlcG/HbpS family heme-binding protein n=1 Tax=Massilia sp. DWR3-1-1 TaxID=2804559 RepID=UPI003CE885EF